MIELSNLYLFINPFIRLQGVLVGVDVVLEILQFKFFLDGFDWNLMNFLK